MTRAPSEKSARTVSPFLVCAGSPTGTKAAFEPSFGK